MANIKSQIKRIKTAERQRVRNKGIRSALKTTIRKFETAVEAGDKQVAQETLHSATRSLDKAVSQGVLHKNNAANKKSSLTRRFNSLAS